MLSTKKTQNSPKKPNKQITKSIFQTEYNFTFSLTYKTITFSACINLYFWIKMHIVMIQLLSHKYQKGLHFTMFLRKVYII